MRVAYKFDELRDQRDMFLVMMDLVRYGMFADDIEIGPFRTSEFPKGIWVRGQTKDVEEFAAEFDTLIGNKAYKKTVYER